MHYVKKYIKNTIYICKQILKGTLFIPPQSKGLKIIVIINGKRIHGGLTDRFRHIMSIYYYCKQHNLEFKLSYTYPCPLEAILLPNKYNWSISESEISNSFWDTKEIEIFSAYKSKHIPKSQEIKYHLDILNKSINKKKKNFQYHIYGNCYFAENKFSTLFNELFLPSEKLKKKINTLLNNIRSYEAIVLRFQQLLGDFQEGNYPILNDIQKNELINRIINKIESLKKEGYFTEEKILVTSDSLTFLKQVNTLPYVFIIPGENIHMDFIKKQYPIETYMKSFVDLLMLSKAKKITCIKTNEMYNTGFPEFAANIGNIKYNLIQI